MKKNYVGSVVLGFLLLATSAVMCSAQKVNGFYGQLTPFFIDAQQRTTAGLSLSDNNAQDATKPKTADLILRELDGNRAAQMTLDILDAYVPTAKLDASAISVLEKFGLAGSGKNSVASKFLSRATVWAKVAFAESCVRPLSYKELSANQRVTHLFADNDQLRKKCTKAFELIKSGHRAYLSYFEPVDEVTQVVLDSVYFGNSMPGRLNTSSVALNGLEAVRWAFPASALAIYSGLLPCYLWSTSNAYSTISAQVAGKQYSSGELTKIWLRELSKVPVDGSKRFAQLAFYTHCPVALMSSEGCIKKIEKLFGRESSVTAEDVENQIPSIQDVFGGVQNILVKGDVPKGIAASVAFVYTYGLIACIDLMTIITAKQTMGEVAQVRSILANYQARLIGMAKIVRGLTMLADVARESGNTDLQQMVEDIELLLDGSADQDLTVLLAALSTSTFVGDGPSFFSNHGRILAAHKRMEKCKSLFVRPLLAAGKIETSVSAADFYVAHKQAEKPVCFVELVNDAEPRLELERAWNVLIDEKRAVCIDTIALGKNGTQNVIFSGPNGTGKSTNENAIAHTVFLGRLGIACASRAVMTPFEIFEVHRNELEDVAKGDSSFMAQKARFDAICSRIAGLTGQRMIIFMDEPLNGTVEAEAGRIIYEKCKELLTQQKQAICLIATHARQPIYLEVDTNGAFANYYVEVVESAPGQFERTYKLRLGTPDRWFNDPEWRHRFVEWLSREREGHNAPAA